MTGNNKVWRASLAGLASVAMLATMGVVAGTANAADAWTPKSVKIDGQRAVSVDYGDSLADHAAKEAADTFQVTANGDTTKKFVGFEGDVSLTAPVTADTTLKPVYAEYAGDTSVDDRSVPVTVYYGGAFTYFDENLGVRTITKADRYLFHAESNKPLSNLFKPVDVAGDGYVATTWKFTGVAKDGKTVDLGTFSDFSQVNAQNYVSITAEPADETNTAKTVYFDYSKADSQVKLTGAAADGNVLPTVDVNQDGAVDAADNTNTVLAVDALKDAEVPAPTFVANPAALSVTIPGSWRNTADDKLVVNAGDKVTVSDDNAKNVYKADNTTVSVVVTYTDGVGDPGKEIDRETVKLDKKDETSTYGYANGTDKLPTRDGYVFNGWKVLNKKTADGKDVIITTTNPATGLDNFPIRNSETLVALWEQTSDIAVTFRDATYKGSHDDVTVKVPNGKVWDGSDAPSWNDRPGYAFVGWSEQKIDNYTGSDADKAKLYTFNQLIGSDKPSFVLYAVYAQVNSDAVEDALKYVSDDTLIGRQGVLGNNNSTLFTATSFKEFKTVWTKVNNEYKEAQYAAQNNQISKETSTDLVKQLADAWQKLAFVAQGSDNADEDGTTLIAYRFYNPITNEHLFTTNTTEVGILQHNPDWNYEQDGNLRVLNSQKSNSAFKALSTFNGNEQLQSVAKPLTVRVQRLYNRITNEHLFTTNQAEVDTLVAGDWTLEPDNEFYAPSPFSASAKSVYRLYNPILNQHLFTANPAEVEKTTHEDWILEGVEFNSL